MSETINSKIEISVVVPVFNEAENLPTFIDRTVTTLKKIGVSYELIFALDPSTDESEDIIQRHCKQNKHIKALIFSRRFGQPAATMAGIRNCSGENCVVIDADLQDQPELIIDLYKERKKGFDVVYAQRKSRKGETLFKRIIAFVGYRVINRLSEVRIPPNTGDFRLISRKVVHELRQLDERHGFLRGLVGFIGYPTTFIQYNRDARFAGKGNYNRYLGSLTIGLNGLVGFSKRPLQLMSIAGFITALLSFVIGLSYLIMFLTGRYLPSGLPTIILVITFFAGIQLLALGLIGEYIGRIYDEVKGRPLYIVEKKINF